MKNQFIKVFAIILLIFGCKPEIVKYTVNIDIKGGAGKYLKIIDMTKPGLAPDSIQLDMGGKYTFEKISDQPGDYIMYFLPNDYVRITPLPNENISLKATYSKLLESLAITGSEGSEKVKFLLQNHKNTLYTLDTLNEHYLNQQMNPMLDTIIEHLAFVRDSVIHAEKKFLQNFIKNQPGTLASYIALSLKIGSDYNMFTIQNDLQYFEMVDTALLNRFDTIDITYMLNTYVKRSKIEKKRHKKDISKNQSIIGTMAPDIVLPNPYGDTLSLSSLKGKYVLVDFWGTWCKPCRQEHPNLRTAYWRYRKRGFVVFQVAIDHDKEAWKNCIREDRLNWIYHVSDLNYTDSKIAKKYGVKSLPANFLINPQGEIIAQDLFDKVLLDSLASIFPKISKPTPTISKGPTQTNSIQ